MKTNATQYLIELFLTQYYLIEAIASGFISDEERHSIYSELAKVFCVDKTSEIDEYYRTSELAQFKSIRDFESYERLCRTIEFAEKTGQDVDLSEIDRIILSQKREAMLRKKEIFRQEKNLTRELIATTLMNTARNGNLEAMVTFTYMEYHGICMCSDKKHSLKYLRLCARWNNLFGCLMGIAYDRENTAQYFNILYTANSVATQKQYVEQIIASHDYTGTLKIDVIAKLLEKAFGLNIIQRNVYDQAYARIAFSAILSIEDKQKILLHKQTDMITSLSEIPFDVKDGNNAVFNESCAESIILKRPDELHMILRNLSVAERCSGEVYKPLLIIGEDESIIEMYMQMITEGFTSDTVVELDAEKLSKSDFSPNTENVFLRGMSEKGIADTVFLIYNCEYLDDECCCELQKMLDYDYRLKFRLSRPTVSLNLSGILPVLFATENNTAVRTLGEGCDIVKAVAIGKDEKNKVIELMFNSRKKLFGCGEIILDDGCRETLAEYNGNQIRQILDNAIRSAVYEDSDTVTKEMIKQAIKELNLGAAGREFGFMGGNRHA